MQRLAASLLATVLLLLLAPASLAQEPGSVQLTLVRQSPWNTPKQPTLEIEVQAQNAGEVALEQLSIGMTLGSPVRSRTAYELSLANDPAVPIHAEVRPREDPLEPGAVRRFAVDLDLSSLPGISRTQSLIYPLKVDLRSGGIPVAALRTPVIFIVKTPQTPLALAWAFVLHAPIQFDPSGQFRSPALEQSLAKGGPLAGAIGALASLATGPRPASVDVVVSPTLLLQLERMSAGYSVVDSGAVRKVAQGQGGAVVAARTLAALAQIVSAEGVHVSAFPFSAPQLPALMAGGLARDLEVQLERGRGEVAELLGVGPDPSILRPPGSALNRTSLVALPLQGVHTLFLDPVAVAAPPPDPLGFAAPPTAWLEAGGSPMTVLVPDRGVSALLASPIATLDPVLGAQAVLGELAVIWLEQPGIERGVTVLVPEGLTLPGAFFGPLVRRIAGAPWLRPVAATALAAEFAPPEQPAELLPQGLRSFPQGYVGMLKHARRLIDTYLSILVDPTDELDRIEHLRTRLLLAESGDFVNAPELGLEMIGSVRDTLAAEFAKVRPDTDQRITLTSSTGTIPVRVSNDTGRAVTVTVELVSPHLRFTGGSGSRSLDLVGTDEVLNFDVELQTTGRFPVQVLVRSPSGRVISQDTLIVRSTDFNVIALFITIGAAAVLLALWARRFLSRARA